MAVSFLSGLIYPETPAFTDLSHSDGDVKPVTQCLPELFRELTRIGRKNINILGRTRLADVGVHGLCSEENRIIPSLQKLKNGLMNL